MARSNSNCTKAKIKLSNRAQEEAATEGYMKERMENLQKSLLESGTYLGAAKSLGQTSTWLKWERVGNADYAVTEREARAGTAEETEEEDADAREPKPAILTAVVQISDDDYWLTACGMWKEPTDVTASLAEVKPSCMGIAPKDETFGQDFPNVLKSLQDIRDSKKSPGCEKQVGMLKNDRIKFRHVLFEKKRKTKNGEGKESGKGKAKEEENEASSTVSSDSEDLPPEFTIAGWPVDFPETEQELRKMEDTHRVNWVDAYDEKGHRIGPAEYRQHLQGALALIRFTVTHWSIKKRTGQAPCDAFVADIWSIRVLSPPDNFNKKTLGGKKRKLYKKDPDTPDMAPKKFKPFAENNLDGDGKTEK